MIDLAEQASTGLDNAAQQAMATQLVGNFINGLVSDQIKMKLLRVNPPTLDEAVNSAIYEVNLRKRFNLRTTGREHFEQSDHEPMDIGHIRPRRWQTSSPARNVPTDRKGRSTPLRNKMISSIGVQGKIGIHKIIPREMSWVTTGATPAGSGVLCVIRHFT